MDDTTRDTRVAEIERLRATYETRATVTMRARYDADNDCPYGNSHDDGMCAHCARVSGQS